VFLGTRQLAPRSQEITEKVHETTIGRTLGSWGAPTSTPLGSVWLHSAEGRSVVGMTNTVQTDSTLEHRIAVVTGASSGIGAATARRLAAAGARVAVLARRAERIEILAAEIGGLAVVADVTSDDAIAAAADRIRTELGRPDLVVANAGVMFGAPFDTAERSEWTAMLETNVSGLIDTGRTFTPDLLAAANDGHSADLVFVGSVASTNYYPTYAVYSATKAAVAALSRGLRAELGPRGVRVRNVEPGLTASELGDGMLDEQARESLAGFREHLESIPASDIAEAIGWAVSQPARVNVAELVVVPTAQG
jgi:NADP-dependent 3-hydroxy acid dehydrogenase YdfG